MLVVVYFWPRLIKLTKIFAKLSFGKDPIELLMYLKADVHLISENESQAFRLYFPCKPTQFSTK